MSTRKIRDAVDLTTGERVYYKGHAKATYMSDGRTVEEAVANIGSSGPNIVVMSQDSLTLTLNPNEIVVIGTPISRLSISGFNHPAYDGDKDFSEQGDVFFAEYTVVFKAGSELALSFPDDVLWANGEMPELTEGTEYELSITYRGETPDTGYYKAVLVPFKSIQ